MPPRSIADLIPYKRPILMNVRVIRNYSIQWNPKDKRRQFYLLTDAYGNAIEAIVATKRKKIDAQVFLYKCYAMDGYVVDPPLGYFQVVDAPATIIIGDRTVFTPIEDAPIPKQHFNFIPHTDLKDRQPQTVLLTDYLCRIESNSAVMKRRDDNLLKMWVIDESQELIEITLWEGNAYTYVNVLEPGQVIAVSSLKVTMYLDNLQLESTPATTIDIDLAIEGHADAIRRLKELPKKNAIAYGYQTEADIRSKITTLASVISKDPVSINNQNFACIASIKEIYGHRTWYSSRCPICNDGVREEEGQLICKHDGNIDNPVYKYCVNATLSDCNTDLPVVFFDNAMQQVLGVDCETLVIREGYTDQNTVPEPMKLLIGKEKIYSFVFKLNNDSSFRQTLEVTPVTVPAAAQSSLQPTTTTAPPTPAAKTPRKQARQNEDANDMPPKRAGGKKT